VGSNPTAFTMHTEEWKQSNSKRTKISQAGERNSQFGKKWMYLDGRSISVKAESVQEHLEQGWKLGRKCEFLKTPWTQERKDSHCRIPRSSEIKEKIRASLINRAKVKRESKIPLTRDESLALNRAKTNAYNMRKRNAIPENADLNLIKKIYLHCPKGYHVDHDLEISRGGKHHQDNLQYLPASENCRKSAGRRFDESTIIRWQDVIQDGPHCQNI
jgi:hypothetical protein